MPISKKQFFNLPRGISFKSYEMKLEILEFMAKNKEKAYTAEEIANELKLLERKVKYALGKLKKTGDIERRMLYYIKSDKPLVKKNE